MREQDGYSYPVDEYGHVTDADGNTTDAYGHLTYSFGFDVEDEYGMWDFLMCLDFLVLDGHVAFEAVRDSDSGGYIEGAAYELVTHDLAVETARQYANWAYDEVCEVYALNVTGPLTDACDQCPPNDAAFSRTRDAFVRDVTNALNHSA